MPRTRRRFTSEFKREAVKLLRENGKPLQQVAAELGVHATLSLPCWRERGCKVHHAALAICS